MTTFRNNDEVSLLLWRDTNLVALLSRLYADSQTKTIRRVQKKGIEEEVNKPKVVCKYNKFMGGIDVADQYISS